MKLINPLIKLINPLIKLINLHLKLINPLMKFINFHIKNSNNHLKKFQGHEMAAKLPKKIKTTLISDLAIFAMMSRVNKVIIGTHTVMANGGLKAPTGCHTVAQAAKHYSVPVMVLMPLYKLSPLYLCSYEQEAFNKHAAPIQGVIDGANASLMEKIHAYNPVYDYVPPELVTLFITNT